MKIKYKFWENTNHLLNIFQIYNDKKRIINNDPIIILIYGNLLWYNRNKVIGKRI